MKFCISGPVAGSVWVSDVPRQWTWRPSYLDEVDDNNICIAHPGHGCLGAKDVDDDAITDVVRGEITQRQGAFVVCGGLDSIPGRGRESKEGGKMPFPLVGIGS